MEYERKGVSITWQIQNIKGILKKPIDLYSPAISLDVMDGTKWRLLLKMFSCPFSITIKRETEDDGPEEFGLHYILSYDQFQGGPSGERLYSCTFNKNQRGADEKLIRGYEYDSFDSIEVRCKMWRQQGTISKSSHFLVRTRIGIKTCVVSIGELKNFSALSEGEKRTLNTISSSLGEKLANVSLNLLCYSNSFEGRNQLQIEINSVDNQRKIYFDLKTFILDSSGKKSDVGKLEVYSQVSPFMCRLPVSRKRLHGNAALYLPNDTLSLHCEITLDGEKEYENVERTELDSTAEGKQIDFYNSVEFLTRRDSFPCDTKLQTNSETFPAHTAILSAQSPVFEAMFKTCMKEVIQNCVRIVDLDAKTVKRMLVFLYSGTLEELNWKDAMELYFAAEKYQILSLKQKCAAFLKQSVDLSNCCVLLLLADMHLDEDLQRIIQDYITKNGLMILNCDQWRDLEKNFPQSAINYFRNRCLKNT